MRLWHLDGAGILHLHQSTHLPDFVWARSASFSAEGVILFGTFGSSYVTYDPALDFWDTSLSSPTAGLNAIGVADEVTYSIGDSGVLYRDGVAHVDLGSPCNFLLDSQIGLLTGGHRGTIFDARSGRELYQHKSPLNCAIELSDRRVLVGSYTGEGLVLRADADGHVGDVRTVRMHNQAIKGLGVSRGFVCSVSAEGDAARWSETDLSLVGYRTGAHDKIANGVVGLSDGRFASVSRDRQLRIWSEDRVDSYASPHRHSIKCVTASRSQRWIATGSYGGEVGFFDLEANAYASKVRPTMSGISCLVPAHDSEGFLASSYDGAVYSVWP